MEENLRGPITQEQLDKIWTEMGMSMKMDRFWAILVRRGLGAMVMPRHVFTNHLKQILVHFLVEGKADENVR